MTTQRLRRILHRLLADRIKVEMGRVLICANSRDAVRRRAVSLRPAGEFEPIADLDAQGHGGPTRSYTSSVPFAPRHTRRHESGFAARRGAVNRSYAPGLTDASRYFTGTLSMSCWPWHSSNC